MELAPPAPLDIGILANQQQPNDDDASSVHEATSRWDVYESMIGGPDHAGSCCHADIAAALPSIVGLRISGVGNVPLPIGDDHANKIKSKATKERTVYKFDADKVKMQHPQWNASLEKVVETVAYKLGVNPNFLTAELDGLLYIEKGGYISRKSCKLHDDDVVLGSLLIQLPSKFTGGEMTVFNSKENEDEDEDEDEESFTFTLGAGADATYSCHFACHFSDCDFELSKLKSGSRLLLQYSLLYEETSARPTASMVVERTSIITNSLSGLSPMNRIVVIPLKDEYRPQSLANTGINVLSHRHRQKAEALKAAGSWKLLIVNAEMVHTHFYYECTNKSSIIDIFDDNGNDVTTDMAWMANVIDFEEFCDESDGMMLAVENDYECVSSECWGTAKSRTPGGEYIVPQSTYRATFLVAYDPLFETEVKCLGGVEGVAEVSSTIADTRDYDLLDRLIAVVEAKEKSKFDSPSSEILIRMLTKSRKDPVMRATLINKILVGLSPTVEPDGSLYEAIIGAVDKFGHDKLQESIEELLSKSARKIGKDFSLFLRRFDFGLQLSSRSEEGAPNYLDDAINDLSLHGDTVKVLNSSTAVNTIMDLISTYSDTDLTNLVDACLNFLHRVIINGASLPFLMDRSLLLEKLLETKRFGSLQSSLTEFASDLVKGLEKTHYSNAKRRLAGDQKGQFVRAIAFVIQHGVDETLDKFGKFALKAPDLFSTLLDAVSKVSGPGLLREILNKCLLQYSIASPHVNLSSFPYSQWTIKKPNEPNILPTPSVHVLKVIEFCPNIVQMMDKDKRLPLHHAVASATASFEVIMEVFKAYKHAASVRDPVTGLYPFQLAASYGNEKASFSLLLENPSLVAPCPAIKGSERKRKRITTHEF